MKEKSRSLRIRKDKDYCRHGRHEISISSMNINSSREAMYMELPTQ
jgi:hypothetical protein